MRRDAGAMLGDLLRIGVEEFGRCLVIALAEDLGVVERGGCQGEVVRTGGSREQHRERQGTARTVWALRVRHFQNWEGEARYFGRDMWFGCDGVWIRPFES